MDLQQVWRQTYESRSGEESQRLQLLRTEREGRLLAIDGCFDHWREVLPLVRAGVKDLIQPGEQPPLRLSEYHVAAVGCPGRDLPASQRAEVFAYLQGGGHLLTTDLCLGHLVTADDWLGTSRVAVAGTCSTELVACELVAPGHALLSGVRPGARWQVEGGGHLIRVVDGQDVEVLITSPDLAARYGAGCDVILLTLEVDRGRLVHFLSHAYAQTTDAQGAQAAATILVNLLDMAVAVSGEGAAGAPVPAPWFRLRALATGEQVTIKSAGGDEERRLDRPRAKALLSELADPDGNLFHRYLNADGTPILEFEFVDAVGWTARVPAASRNRILLNGTILDAERSVSNGDTLALFSAKAGGAVEGCDFVVEFPD